MIPIKNQRQEKIYTVIKNASKPLPITEVDNQLYYQFNLEFSRRTVARDLKYLESIGLIKKVNENSVFLYELDRSGKVSIDLSRDEIEFILNLLDGEIDETAVDLKEILAKTL